MRIRVVAVAAVVIGVLVLAGCSSGGGSKASSKSQKSPTCSLVTRLDNIANGIAHADVSNPQGFSRQFSAAVDQYVTTVRKLRRAAPSKLSASLDRVAADVQQYRFSDALTDRADLDDYAKTACRRTVVAVVLAPSSTVPLVAPTTAPNATGTTVASGFTTVSSTTAG